MPASQLLMPLLGAIIGQQAPEQNPDAWTTDEYGNRVLKPGATPYKPAGFGTKWLHPEVAAQIGMLNNEDYQAALANAIQNKVRESNINIARPGIGQRVQDMSTPTLAQFTQGNAANIPNIQEEMAKEREGVPGLTAQELATQRMLGIKSNIANLNKNIPELRAGTEASELGTRGLMANVGADEANRMLRHKEDLDTIYGMGTRTSLADKATELGLANTRYGMLPEQQGAMENLYRRNLLDTSIIQPQGSPLIARINPDGSISSGEQNPFYLSEYAAKMAGMRPGLGMGSALGDVKSASGVNMRLPDGTPIPVTPKHLSPRGEYIQEQKPQIPINPGMVQQIQNQKEEEKKTSAIPGLSLPAQAALRTATTNLRVQASERVAKEKAINEATDLYERLSKRGQKGFFMGQDEYNAKYQRLQILLNSLTPEEQKRIMGQ